MVDQAVDGGAWGLLASADLRHALEHGKYSGWLVRVDQDQLLAALFAVGEFGSRFAEMRLAGGDFPVLDRAVLAMPVSRVFDALKAFAVIRREGRADATMPSGWDQAFSDSMPAFSQSFRARLSADADTAWLAAIDQRSFALMVWMIGEITIRFGAGFWLDYSDSRFGPTFFSKEHAESTVMSAALYVIALVASGSCLTLAEARRLLELARLGPDAAGSDCLNDKAVAAEFVRVVPDGEGLAMEVSSIRWEGPYEPKTCWHRYATFTAAVGDAVMDGFAKAVLADHRYFRVCGLCRRRKPVGWMQDSSSCQSCAERHLGIVS